MKTKSQSPAAAYSTSPSRSPIKMTQNQLMMTSLNYPGSTVHDNNNGCGVWPTSHPLDTHSMTSNLDNFTWHRNESTFSTNYPSYPANYYTNVDYLSLATHQHLVNIELFVCASKMSQKCFVSSPQPQHVEDPHNWVKREESWPQTDHLINPKK